MALELNLDITLTLKDDALQLAIFDCTGEYVATLNETGFGTPNPELTDVTSSSLDITFPDGTVYTYDTTTILPDVSGQWQYLTYTDITGQTEGSFVDGHYQFVYTVNTATETFTFEAHKLFYNNVCCCISNKYADFSFPVCDPCEGEPAADLCELNLMWGMLQALQAQACLGLTDRFNNTLGILQTYCNVDTNCNKC
jgi:hypothetical protein